MATVIGATMWFWIFLRAKEDGGALIGLHKPWEAHGTHADAHGDDAHAGDAHAGDAHGDAHAAAPVAKLH